MKVVCDNCRAVYRVPDAKLVKAVNKATCRNCGHRMLIPRPKPGADPEERTLVTAVPPTPVGAPPRVDGGHTRPMPEDDHESTLPGRAPDGGHDDRNPDDFDGPSTVVSDMPPGMPATSYPPPSVPGPATDEAQRTTLVQAPPPGARQPPARRSTPSSPPRRTPMPAAPRRTQAGVTRRHSPQGGAPLYGGAPDAHDPSSDLNWALFGTAASLCGSSLLAVLSVYNHALLMWFGLAFAFGGGVLTFMVLLTGGRGRRPAKTLMSVVLGFIVALVMSTSMVGTKWTAEKVVNAWDINFANPNLGGEPALPEPVAAAPSPAPAPGEAPAPAPAPEPADDGSTDAADEEPEPKPSPKPSPKPKSSPSPSPRPSPSPSPVPVPVPVPAPAPAAQPGQMKTVPPDVIHVMLSNNLEVKKCFVPMFRAGTLPGRVDVKFTIQAPGNATGIFIRSPPTLKSSELERCLQAAIARISFPPTSGSGTNTTYPFVLK